MAEVQEKVHDVAEGVQDKVSSGTGNTIMKAAAAAAATTAATYAVKKAFSHDSEDSEDSSKSNGSSNGSSLSSKGSGILASAAATSWDAASDVLLPLADDLAESAGKYAATHGPEILRERIIPKFIETFNEAK